MRIFILIKIYKFAFVVGMLFFKAQTLVGTETNPKGSEASIIRAILFDHDDTLVRTIEAKWAQHKYIAKTFYGKDLKDEEIGQHWGKPLPLLIQILYETEDVEKAMFYNTCARANFPKRLFDDTLETLEALRKTGIKTGIVTATTLLSLENDFATLGISRELFDYIQTQEDTMFHKPDPLVFEPALQWLLENGIQPHEVIYVGDSLNDMRAAIDAGLHFIGVGTGLVSIEEFAEHKASVVKKLSEVALISRGFK